MFVCHLWCWCLSQDELLAELDELEQEELDKNLLEIGGTENVPLPNVPSTSLPARPGKSLLKPVVVLNVCDVWKYG